MRGNINIRIIIKNHYIPQQYLPDELEGAVYYEPSGQGFEKEIRVRRKEDGGR